MAPWGTELRNQVKSDSVCGIVVDVSRRGVGQLARIRAVKLKTGRGQAETAACMYLPKMKTEQHELSFILD
jgi:hypothetical protein